jgi:hypothetical protein
MGCGVAHDGFVGWLAVVVPILGFGFFFFFFEHFPKMQTNTEKKKKKKNIFPEIICI